MLGVNPEDGSFNCDNWQLPERQPANLLQTISILLFVLNVASIYCSLKIIVPTVLIIFPNMQDLIVQILQTALPLGLTGFVALEVAKRTSWIPVEAGQNTRLRVVLGAIVLAGTFAEKLLHGTLSATDIKQVLDLVVIAGTSYATAHGFHFGRKFVDFLTGKTS